MYDVGDLSADKFFRLKNLFLNNILKTEQLKQSVTPDSDEKHAGRHARRSKELCQAKNISMRQ